MNRILGCASLGLSWHYAFPVLAWRSVMLVLLHTDCTLCWLDHRRCQNGIILNAFIVSLPHFQSKAIEVVVHFQWPGAWSLFMILASKACCFRIHLLGYLFGALAAVTPSSGICVFSTASFLPL
jgi:hypothetical protein